MQCENRLNDSVKYVDQYATVLLVRDELGKKWAKCMRDLCFGGSAAPTAAAQSSTSSTTSSLSSSVASHTPPSTTQSTSGTDIQMTGVDSHVALDATLPWCEVAYGAQHSTICLNVQYISAF